MTAFLSLLNSVFFINHIESMNREMKAIQLNYSGLDFLNGPLIGTTFYWSQYFETVKCSAFVINKTQTSALQKTELCSRCNAYTLEKRDHFFCR